MRPTATDRFQVLWGQMTNRHCERREIVHEDQAVELQTLARLRG